MYFYSPDDVRANDQPALFYIVKKVNEQLLEGKRNFNIPMPFVSRVKIMLEQSGWSVKISSYNISDLVVESPIDECCPKAIPVIINAN